MSYMDGQRAAPEEKLVAVGDTFYSKDASTLFCVMEEFPPSGTTGIRSFRCEDTLDESKSVTLLQSTIVDLMAVNH